jgi:transposase InsO family protein
MTRGSFRVTSRMTGESRTRAWSVRRLVVWAGRIVGLLLAPLLLLVLIGFSVLAVLRERATRTSAAPSTGRFVRADDVDVFIQEAGPATGVPLHSAGEADPNAFVESFNGKLRAECLDAHMFLSLEDARAIIEDWRPTSTRSVHTARWATARLLSSRRRGP